MKKLTVLIDGTGQLVRLQESMLVTRDSYLFVKKATIFWTFMNFNELNSYQWWSGASETSLGKGYHTFKMLKNEMERSVDGVKLKSTDHNGRCQIVNDSPKLLTLNRKLADVLGFTVFVVNAGRTPTSVKPVEMNKRLRYIKIGCNEYQ